MDTAHRCISVELNDRQPFWPAMCQVDYRVTVDVAPDRSWEVTGFELADVRKASVWYPIGEDHPLWPILARDVREPQASDEVEDGIRHLDWTRTNIRESGDDPTKLRGFIGIGLTVLDPTEARRAAALASGLPQAGDMVRSREDPAALSLA